MHVGDRTGGLARVGALNTHYTHSLFRYLPALIARLREFS
jgi:hypothetical protein